MKLRNLQFALLTLAGAGLYAIPLKALVVSSVHSDIYPYTATMPLFTAALLYRERKRIYSRVRYDWGLGAALMILGLVIRWSRTRYDDALHADDSLSLVGVSFVVLCLGAFVSCYGAWSLRAAAFPLSLLFIMIPLPQFFVQRSVLFLRGASADAAASLLRWGGVPVFQNGFVLSLPGRDVEVAEICSGIRSALALFFTSLLMGYLFLRSPWRRLWLVLAVLPVAIFKNGLRIVMVYWLTVHSNMEDLAGWVHRNAGVPFCFLGLSLLALLVICLRKFEEPSFISRWIIEEEVRAGEKASDPTLELTC